MLHFNELDGDIFWISSPYTLNPPIRRCISTSSMSHQVVINLSRKAATTWGTGSRWAGGSPVWGIKTTVWHIRRSPPHNVSSSTITYYTTNTRRRGRSVVSALSTPQLQPRVLASFHLWLSYEYNTDKLLIHNSPWADDAALSFCLVSTTRRRNWASCGCSHRHIPVLFCW